MTDRVAALLVLGALVAAATASAETHRWVDTRGVVNYSDRAPQPPGEPAVSVAVAAPAEPVSTAAVAPNGPITLDTLFELTGTRRQLAGLTVRLAREFRPAKGQVSAAAEATIERIVARTFHQDAILRGVREEFARGLDRPQLEAKQAWLRSPLGHRIAALEMATADPAHDRQVAEFTARLAAAPPSDRPITTSLPEIASAIGRASAIAFRSVGSPSLDP